MSKLNIIRIIIIVLLISANFFIGWYLTTRFLQLNEPILRFRSEEVNNPRLNLPLIEKIISEFENREEYKETQIDDSTSFEYDLFK